MANYVKVLCTLFSSGLRYAISMSTLISLRHMQITNCFGASATQSRVTPLILRASNTTRFSSRSVVQLLQFHPKSTSETISEGQKSKIFCGEERGHVPRPPSRCATPALNNCILDPPFKILYRSATAMWPMPDRRGTLIPTMGVEYCCP